MSQSIDIYLTYCAMKLTLEKVTMTLLSSMVRQRYQETRSGKEKTECGS